MDMDERMDELKDGMMYERMDKRKDGKMDGWMNE